MDGDSGRRHRGILHRTMVVSRGGGDAIDDGTALGSTSRGRAHLDDRHLEVRDQRRSHIDDQSAPRHPAPPIVRNDRRYDERSQMADEVATVVVVVAMTVPADRRRALDTTAEGREFANYAPLASRHYKLSGGGWRNTIIVVDITVVGIVPSGSLACAAIVAPLAHEEAIEEAGHLTTIAMTPVRRRRRARR